MADIQSNIQVNIDTSEALASIKSLQKQISVFHTSMAKSGAAAAAASANLQQNLINSLNATGKFSAEMRTVRTSAESFTNALEKNKLSMREYFRYAGASTKTFGRFFKSEFETINKVARERVKDLQTQYIKMGRDANGAMKAIAVRPLALDMQNLGTQTQIAAQRQQLLNQLLKQGSTNLLNFGKNTQWAGRQLMVGFTIPLMYFGTAASKVFMKLEEQAIRFKRVYGEMFTTATETDRMLTDIKLLAKEFTKYGVAVEETMKMAADAAAQGKMGADLLAQVNQATRLAVLGGVEQEQALETTISLTNAFGIAAEDLTKKINFLNAVENQTIVSIEDLTIAIPKAGPVVKQLGGDVEDLAFFLTAMKEGGINASEGANALKSGLASLINPTKKASEMLGSMGINISGIVESNKGNIKGIVTDFAYALDTLDPLNRARAIEQLFGKFQFARLSTLFQNVIQEGTQANRVLKLTQATTEELAILSERELKRVEDSPMYKFKKAVEDLKVTIAPVGESFLKAITPIVEFIGKVLDKFNNLSDGAKNFTVILTTVLAGIGPVALMTFGLLANGVANIIKLFTSVKSVFNRASVSTTDLASQTNYMTQQQLEAAAVAASLDQVHNKLTQSFTSEANAINNLVVAYERAIAAQRAFAPGAGGFVPGGKGGRGPKKFNKGTAGVRYYAQGTDTVPAMLTPGEAVIPAGPAQEPGNKKAIKFMIAGGILGQYDGGTDGISAIGTKSKKATTNRTLPTPIVFGGQSFPSSTTKSSIEVQKMIKLAQTLSTEISNIDDIIAAALRNVSQKTKVSAKAFDEEMRRLTSGVIGFPKKTGASQLSGLVGTTQKVQGGFAGNAGVVAAHGNAGIALTPAQANQLGKEIDKVAPGNATARDLMATKNIAGLKSNLVFPMPASFNKGQMTGAEGAKWVGQNRSRFTSLVAKQYGVDPNDPGLLDFGKRVGMALKKVGKTAVDDSQFYEIIEREIEASLNKAATDSTRKAGQVLRKAGNEYGTVSIAAPVGAKRSKPNRPTMPVAAQGLLIPGQGPDKTLSKKSYRDQTQAMGLENNKSADKFVWKIIKKRLRNFTGLMVKGFEDGVKEELKVASPSKRMKKVGQQGGQGLVQGAQEYVDDAKVTGQNIGSAIVTGSQSQLAATSRTTLYGTGPVDPAQKSLRRQLDKQAKRDAAIQKKATQSRNIYYGGQQGPIDADQKSLRRQLQKQEKLRKIAEKAAYKQSQVTGLVAGGVGQRNNTQETQPKRGIGMTGGMMAASGVMMAASMAPGKVGEMAQKLMMPMMALTMLLPMLTSPIGIAIVAITALAAVAIKLRMAFDKAQDSAMDLAETMGSGDKAIQELGKFAGTVSAGEIMDRRRKESLTPFAIKTGKTTFGESYMQSEGGKALLSGVTKSIKSVGTDAAGTQLINQLVTAMASGTINASQARSIVANIGEQLGDYSFSLNVNAKLASFVGVNGENLLTDPVGIRVKLMQDTRNKFNLSSVKAQQAGSLVDAFKSTKLTGIERPLNILTMGLYGGAKVINKRNDRLGEATGATIGLQKMALEQQQEMLDSLDLEYEKKINIAKAAKDQDAVERLIKERSEARTKLLDENAITLNEIAKSYKDSEGATQKALMTGVDKAITKKYKGTALEEIVPLAKAMIDDSGLSGEKQMVLKLQLAAGNIDPMQMMSIFETFGKDQKSINKVLNIMTKFGGTTANQAMSVANMFGDKGNAKQVKKDFIMAVSEAGTSEEAQKILDFYTKVAQTGNVLNSAIIVDLLLKDEDKAKKLQDSFNKISALEGPITIPVLTEILNKDELDALNDDLDYFSSLKDEQKKIYLQTLITTMQTVSGSDPAFINWLKSEGSTWNKPFIQPGVKLQKYAEWNARRLTEESTQAGAPNKTGNILNDKNKVQASPLDDLLKKLRDVRKLTIKVTEGWDASMKSLNNLFSGDKVIKGFNGIEQSMRRLGAQENLIDLITGMDPKEYENRKKQLFEFDDKDNIKQLKKNALIIQEALNSATIGTFQTGIEKQFKEITDQNIALKELSKLGVPVSNAYELVADKTLAAAIATAKNEAAVKRMINEYKRLMDAQKKQQALENVNKDLEKEKLDAFQKDRIYRNYSYEDSFAILSDANLLALEDAIAKQKEVLKKALAEDDQREIFKAQSILNDMIDKFNERLNQLKNTIEYMQGIFDDGFGKAMEWFDAQEKSIEIAFQKATLADQDIIQKAQDDISKFQYQIDDLQANLTDIERQEEKVNKAYEARIKALDAIAAINQQIIQQQKSQLTIADALSQGDISAAARAAQELRAQTSQNAIENQRKALDQSRENTLKNLRSNGFTRLEIEEKIKDLQYEIFKIEEQRLEPAAERIRLAEIDKREAIESLKVLGLSKLEWEEIKNGIDLARTSSLMYQAAMQAALDIVDKIKKYWEELDGKTYTTYHRVITVTGGDGSQREVDDAMNDLPNAQEETAPNAEEQAAIDQANADAEKENAKNKADLEKAISDAKELNAKNLAALNKKLAKNAAGNVSALTKQKMQYAAQAAGWANRKPQAGFAMGGLVPKYFAVGGFAQGTDTVPAMLTPGEFVVRKYAVDNFGLDKLKAINDGTYDGGTVYNYELTVNVKSDSDADQIANVVMGKIRQIDSMRVKGNRI